MSHSTPKFRRALSRLRSSLGLPTGGPWPRPVPSGLVAIPVPVERPGRRPRPEGR